MTAAAPAAGRTWHVARDLEIRPSCSTTDAWLASWGEGSKRETIEVSAGLAGVLSGLPDQVTEAQVANRLAGAMPEHNAAELTDYLAGHGLLRVEADEPSPMESRLRAMNWDDAVTFHKATRGMLWRHEYPADAQVMTWYNGDEVVPPGRPRPRAVYDDLEDTVALSEPRSDLLDVPVHDVLQRRRTKRSFAGSTLSEPVLSGLLHAAFRPIIQGETRRYFTTLSSADGYREKDELHPLTTWVLLPRPGTIPGQLDSVYRYNPDTHALQSVRRGALPEYFAFSDLLWGQEFADDAPAALVLSINWPQFMWKYRVSHAYRFARYDAGAYMQTAQLVGTALGLNTFITPAMDDVRMTRLLGTREHLCSPAYFLALGARRVEPPVEDNQAPYL